jgi:hypothetical protein
MVDFTLPIRRGYAQFTRAIEIATGVFAPLFVVQPRAVNGVDASETYNGNWQQIADEDPYRTGFWLQNKGTDNMALYFAPEGNNGAPPNGSWTWATKGVFVVGPGWTSDGAGGLFKNEIWIRGTATQHATVLLG